MIPLEKLRERIAALDESEARSLLMMIAAYVDMVYSGNGKFTSEDCLNEIRKMYGNIPERGEGMARLERDGHD